MAMNIKLTKFDNTPWGFRLAGGSDFPHPLTVIKVAEGSLAECMGLKVGDVVVRLNDEPISNLTHGQAHEALILAGNNFTLGVHRQVFRGVRTPLTAVRHKTIFTEEDPLKAVQGISEDNIVPYKVSLDQVPPVYPESILLEDSAPEKPEEEAEVKCEEPVEIDVKSQEEIVEKPKDADSEVVPNQNLTDDEIAQLILEEEELLVPEQGVLGVNFKKLRPRLPNLKQSKVVEELQSLATEDPPRVKERKHVSTFLQKPQRPIPTPRGQKQEEPEAPPPESYRVVIKKQEKKSVTKRLLEKGLLHPGPVPTPEYRSEATTPCMTPDPLCRSDHEGSVHSRPASKVEVLEETELSESIREIEEISVGRRDEEISALRREDQQQQEEKEGEEGGQEGRRSEEPSPAGKDEGTSRERAIVNGIEREMQELAAKVDREKIKELVTTEIDLEKQLETVQSQLLALKQLPTEIENHLRIVSEQLQMIIKLSGLRNQDAPTYYAEDERGEERERKAREEEHEDAGKRSEDSAGVCEDSFADVDETEDRPSTGMSDEPPRIIVPDESEDESETKELEISVKSDDDSGRVKKLVVSYQSKVLKSREPSPTPSQGTLSSFEPDPTLSPKDQVIQELKHKRGRKHSQDLWPQAKQLELTLGRRWRCPNDFFNDETIAEVLCSQAEVIRGRALGINFKKYEKTNLPNYDHLMNSSVYKMIHKMEREPRKGIPARPPKVNAAEDIIERVRSPAFSLADDRSIRSISH